MTTIETYEVVITLLFGVCFLLAVIIGRLINRERKYRKTITNLINGLDTLRSINTDDKVVHQIRNPNPPIANRHQGGYTPIPQPEYKHWGTPPGDD